MADVFDFYVYDNRSIVHTSPEPIMQEDKDVAVWRFRIPKVLNNIDMSAWAWWFVYVNAKGQKFSELLTLNNDIDDPEEYSIADYSIGYGISKTPGGFTFALEAINAEQGGEISGEWHTRTYAHTVTPTLQGNQAEYAETESDVISALIVEVQNRINSLIGGATPLVVSSVSAMTDTSKIYVLSTDGNWYYHNGTTWVSGGTYASGITIDPTLSQRGQAADAKVVGDELSVANEKLQWKEIDAIWHQGGLSFSTGAYLNRVDRVYTSPMPASEISKVIVNQSYSIGLCEYDSNGNYLNSHPAWLGFGKGFSKSDIDTNATTIRLVIKNGDGASYPITPSDITKNVINIVTNTTILDTIDYITTALCSGDWSNVFEHGSLANGINDTYNANARVRTINSILCDKDLHIIYNSGVYQIHYLTSNGEFYDKTGWLTNDRIIPANTPFRLLVTQDATQSALVDIKTILEGITIKECGSRNAFSASPNIIFACRAVDDTAYPPESKWYVKSAAQNQYDRVRFTVRKSTDGYWFCCHNTNINDLARNLDGTVISGDVAASGKTLAELNAYDWGIKYGKKYAGFNVPMLEDGLKYASIYNLGVTMHFTLSQYETSENIAELLTMMDKYGITDNAIIISANGHNFNTFNMFKAHNPRVSYYFGGEESWWNESSNVDLVKSLQTEYNKLYVQLYPWGTAPTEDFISLAKTNNFVLYDSITMSKSDLLNINTFNKGYGFMEVQNVYMIKDTIRNWVDGLIT